MATFFSDFFAIDESVIEDFGAFNISLVNDLPLFIDPFLLFNSGNKEFNDLHDQIITYLVFLRDRAGQAKSDEGLLQSWYCFGEVRQNWLGFSVSGNSGSGLGLDFARVLCANLDKIFKNFGAETITESSHLEKVCLIADGVGRDSISDFTTNLILDYLCRYTERFAKEHLSADQVREIASRRARFNYTTETWEVGRYKLPWCNSDYVILTPIAILTRDENWINKDDLVSGFEKIPAAIPDNQLRAEVSNYFHSTLVRHKDRHPSKKEVAEAAAASDVGTEANDGRGPVDFKISRGAPDKTLVEMKLAKNSKLEKNLAKQVEIYKSASDAKRAIKVIVFFSAAEEERVAEILIRLKLSGSRDVVVIDARNDNKPSGSKA